jgi:uncharacterized repeat protein (TIGR01451 family)
LLLSAALAVTAAVVVATAGATTIPSNFFVVTDQQGANDVPGQVDLTQLGRDDTDSTVFKLFWSWDAVGFTSQTGDACALFDYNGNGNVDAVVCGQIQNGPQWTAQNPQIVQTTAVPSSFPSGWTTGGSPFVFRCVDSSADRCSQPSAPRPYTRGTDIVAGALGSSISTSPPANLVTNTDPFSAGESNPNDSTLEIAVLKSYLATLAGNLGSKYPAIANPTPTLVNVCSYPSAGNGGNNNPFDCVVNPGGGFLKIVKNATGADATTTSFPFTVDPGTISKSITGSGDTGAFSVPIGTAYSVAESVPSNWNLSSASCTLEGGGSTGSLSGSTLSSVTVQSGKITTCTFNDTENNPALSIEKTATESGFSAVGDVIHYSVVATNSGNVTLSSVTVTDANASGLSCTPANGSSLAPGASMNCTASHTITQADLDAGSFYNQACVDDGSGGAASVCDDVTTPGTQNPALSLTKSDDLNPAKYDHVGQVVTYTLTATNSGNITLHNVSVSDSPALDGFSCTPSIPVASLAPGGTVTCTGTHAITQADLDAGSFADTASATSNEDNAPNADDTVYAAPQQTAQITPTQTTCQAFLAGTSPDLSSLSYGVKSNKINSVSPGVFFYYSKITAPSASFTIAVTESNLLGWRLIGLQQGQAILYDSNCNKFDGTGTQSATSGTITYSVTGATAGATYVIGIKYDPGTLVGQSVQKTQGHYPSNTYSYATSINGGDITSSHDSIDVVPR